MVCMCLYVCVPVCLCLCVSVCACECTLTVCTVCTHTHTHTHTVVCGAAYNHQWPPCIPMKRHVLEETAQGIAGGGPQERKGALPWTALQLAGSAACYTNAHIVNRTELWAVHGTYRNTKRRAAYSTAQYMEHRLEQQAKLAPEAGSASDIVPPHGGTTN